jgi:ribosomal protein L10
MAQDFDTVLGLFKKNMVEYKVSGNSAYKIAAENAQKWLDDYVGTLEAAAMKDSQFVDKFVKDYSKTNPELAKMQEEIRKVRKEGPKMEDKLDTERLADKEIPIDTSGYYVKAGVIGTALAIAAVASLFP